MSDFEVSQAKKDAVTQEAQAVLSTKAMIIGAIGLAVLYGFAQAVIGKLIK